jgi:hypothetical protein
MCFVVVANRRRHHFKMAIAPLHLCQKPRHVVGYITLFPFFIKRFGFTL